MLQRLAEDKMAKDGPDAHYVLYRSITRNTESIFNFLSKLLDQHLNSYCVAARVLEGSFYNVNISRVCY